MLISSDGGAGGGSGGRVKSFIQPINCETTTRRLEGPELTGRVRRRHDLALELVSAALVVIIYRRIDRGCVPTTSRSQR